MKRIYYHILFWLVYLTLQVYIEVSWIISNYPELPLWKQFLNGVMAEILMFCIKVPFIYTSFFIIRYYTLERKKNSTALLLLLLLFIVATLLSHLCVIEIVFPYLYKDHLFRPFFSSRIFNSFFDLIFIAGIANAIKQYRSQVVLREQEKNLIQEKLTAELIFLKAQINPHFLFNTLNSLYALARKKSDQTEHVILKLSSLLRFILYEAEKTSISVSQEISILENYIELEQIRYENKLSIRFEKSIEDDHFHITPLLLLPFVENAFKHGPAETRNDSKIVIKLLVKKEGELQFVVQNTTENEPTEIVENIGLKNVHRQLALLYPEHQLHISNREYIFKIDLRIKLKKE